MYITVSWHLLPSKSHLYISSKIWRSLAPRRLQWEYAKCNSISCWVPKMGDQVKIQLFMIPQKQQWFFKSSGDTFAGRPAICSSTRFGHCREAFSNANFQFGIFLWVFSQTLVLSKCISWQGFLFLFLQCIIIVIASPLC